ncbi:MAG: Ig-like domain-containing protein [Bacteroidota bacterium]
MERLKKYLSFLFILWIGLVLWQCARRGNPTGGPEDVTPPELIRTEPDNFSTEFTSKSIRLYFDEFIKLEDVQNQLIISPPLEYLPEIKPQGGVSKYVEVIIKDTLKENTTYTLNFGQSIVDNNEGNPNSFLTYVFSTGTYIDSLTLSGAVKDAYNRKADEFISVMLYEIDTAFTDSTVFKKPPNYISNTLDSLPIFELKNLKEGKYKLVAIKDLNKNNLFDQRQDKIGFIEDTITLPTDSIYLLNLFQETPNYSASVPSYVAKNRIIFGYQGLQEEISIESLTDLPDSVRTTVRKDRETDTLNYWLTSTDLDSIVFMVRNTVLDQMDTFTVKTRKLDLDSLKLSNNVSGKFGFEENLSVLANTPISAVDTSQIEVFLSDSIPYNYNYVLDSLKNQVDFQFEKEANQSYTFNFYPGAVTDFFGFENDSLSYKLTTGSYADFGNLRVTLSGAVRYPMIVQLTTEQGETQREVISEIPSPVEFNNLDPGKYMIRVIFDDNANGIWDTGSYLKKVQPEKVSYYPDVIEVRANWELEQSFIIAN